MNVPELFLFLWGGGEYETLLENEEEGLKETSCGYYLFPQFGVCRVLENAPKCAKIVASERAGNAPNGDTLFKNEVLGFTIYDTQDWCCLESTIFSAL